MQGPEYDVHDVVVRLGANENRTRVTLGKQLNHVKEVHLNEYAIRNPNGGALTPSLWRFNFNGGDFYSEVTTNAQGSGYPFVIDSATMVHVIYTRPRVMSRDGKGKIDWLQFTINDETGANVTFDDATFYLSFVCEVPRYDVDRVISDDLFDNTTGNRNFTTQIRGGLPGI